MVTNPLDYVEPLGKAGASGFTFHVEVSKGELWYRSYFLLFGLYGIFICSKCDIAFSENWQELVERIRSKGMRPGVALKPGTPIEEVYPLVSILSLSFLVFRSGLSASSCNRFHLEKSRLLIFCVIIDYSKMPSENPCNYVLKFSFLVHRLKVKIQWKWS